MSSDRTSRERRKLYRLHVGISSRGILKQLDTLFENPEKSTRNMRGELSYRIRKNK